jgi:hypothetical protein
VARTWEVQWAVPWCRWSIGVLPVACVGDQVLLGERPRACEAGDADLRGVCRWRAEAAGMLRTLSREVGGLARGGWAESDGNLGAPPQ